MGELAARCRSSSRAPAARPPTSSAREEEEEAEAEEEAVVGAVTARPAARVLRGGGGGAAGRARKRRRSAARLAPAQQVFCGWTGALKLLRAHAAECEFAPQRDGEEDDDEDDDDARCRRDPCRGSRCRCKALAHITPLALPRSLAAGATRAPRGGSPLITPEFEWGRAVWLLVPHSALKNCTQQPLACLQ